MFEILSLQNIVAWRSNYKVITRFATVVPLHYYVIKIGCLITIVDFLVINTDYLQYCVWENRNTNLQHHNLHT